MLHGHIDLTDGLSPIEIARSFFGANEQRQIFFEKFQFKMGVYQQSKLFYYHLLLDSLAKMADSIFDRLSY